MCIELMAAFIIGNSQPSSITITKVESSYEIEIKRQETLARERARVAPLKQIINVGNAGSYDELLKKYFGGAWLTARKVMIAESGGRANAVGDGRLRYWQNGVQYGDSHGLFQIRYLPGRPNPGQLHNPEFNIAYASGLYKSNGWRPWSVCKRMKCN